MASLTEKREIEEIEHTPSIQNASTAAASHSFDTEEHELPKGYYYSPFFLGTTCAIGFNLMVACIPFRLPN